MAEHGKVGGGVFFFLHPCAFLHPSLPCFFPSAAPSPTWGPFTGTRGGVGTENRNAGVIEQEAAAFASPAIPGRVSKNEGLLHLREVRSC